MSDPDRPESQDQDQDQDSDRVEAEVFVPPESDPEPFDRHGGDPDEPGELELDSGSGGRSGWSEEEERDGGSAWLVPTIVGVLLVLILGGWLWMRSSKEPPKLSPVSEAPPPPAPPAEGQASAPEPEVAEPPLPPLRESDPWVREAVRTVLQHPRLGAWLAPEGLVTRFVAAVDDIARGESPRPHLVSMDPGRGFQVDEAADGTQAIAPRSFRRYDPIVEAFVAMDTAEGMRLYRRLEPLFQESYRELGYPDADFRAALETAIDRLLEVEVPAQAPEVVPRITSWAFADPELEAMSPAEKHLLRLGPTNARKIQSKLRTLKTALTLEPAPRPS